MTGWIQHSAVGHIPGYQNWKRPEESLRSPVLHTRNSKPQLLNAKLCQMSEKLGLEFGSPDAKFYWINWLFYSIDSGKRCWLKNVLWNDKLWGVFFLSFFDTQDNDSYLPKRSQWPLTPKCPDCYRKQQYQSKMVCLTNLAVWFHGLVYTGGATDLKNRPAAKCAPCTSDCQVGHTKDVFSCYSFFLFLSSS